MQCVFRETILTKIWKLPIGKASVIAAILNIIDEEVSGYFSGQKDIEETTEIIQNRVQLYLQENME